MFPKSHTHKQPKWGECSSRRKYLWRQHLFVIVHIWQRQEMKEWNEPQLWIPSSVFSNPKLSRLGRKAFLSWTMSSREERRSLQLPHALCPGSHFKGSCLRGKPRAHWPMFIYSLIPCKLVFFLKIKSEKYFASCLFGPPPGSHICFLYFCVGCSTSLVLMELVSFLGPPLLLMFLLLVHSSMFVVSWTIFFY